MSLRNKVTSAVDKAFKAVGDLVVSGTLSSKSVTGYDFSTGLIASTSTSTVVEVIKLTKTNPLTNATSTEAIIKSGVDISVYDTLTIDGVEYNIGDYDDNEFIITLQIKKEHE